jgi:ligand-binding sensor domain-containing protein
LQDRRGFLWFGTEDGLNRYDGRTFKVFKPNPEDPFSISDRWINALYEDRAGNLWVGTRLGGLNRYDPQTGRFTHYTHDPSDPVGMESNGESSDPASLSSNAINAIYEDERGILWVGTDDGLDWLDPTAGVVTHVRSIPDSPFTISGDEISAIVGDSKGNIWVGTKADGLNRYLTQSHSFVRYPIATVGRERICSARITSLAEALDGMIWIGTSNGLSRLNPKDGTAQCLQNNPSRNTSLISNEIQSLFVDSAGNLWVGSSRALELYLGATGEFMHFVHDPSISDSLSADTVLSIYEDRGGAFWIGAYGGGLNKREPTEDRFALFRNDKNNPASLSSNFVFPIHVDPRGRVWVGTYGGGLNLFNPSTGEFAHFRHNPENINTLADDNVWSIFTDSSGQLWVGAGNHLSKINPITGEAQNYPADAMQAWPGAVYAMTEDASGQMWLGTENGLGRFDRTRGAFLPENFTSPNAAGAHGRVQALWIDKSSNTLWFGTLESGLYRYDLNTRELTRFHTASGASGNISHNTIYCIYRDEKGTLWIATGGGGLNRFNAVTETFESFTEKDGLANSVVYGILEDDDGALWLSANHGLSRFIPSFRAFQNFYVSDGLGSMEFNPNGYARSQDGTLYFGSSNGLNVLRPENISDSKYVPSVALTALTIDGESITADAPPEAIQSITLQAPQNSFEFEFVALGYTASERNQYAYKLEGFDEDWRYLGDKYDGRYTNLPGGSYTLLLKASNSDGVWNDDPLAIAVTVIPPFWETLQFRLSLGFVVGLLVLGIYRLRIRQAENRNRELEGLVKARTSEMEKLFERTKELAVVEERNRLARDLHDSAKQKAFAALAQLGTVNGLPQGSPAAHRHLLEAENLVAEVIQELTFLIQEMYPAALMEKGLPTTVREYIFEWKNRNDIAAEVKIESPRPLDLKVEQTIYRVIQESLANVARHSQASRVDVDLTYRPDCIEVIIADNGRGFDTQTGLGGLGLRSMRERVESMAGTIKFESQTGQGARIILSVPISPNSKEGKNGKFNIHPDR